MARIRSVHPGLWTDEAFVSVSPLARLLAIGIWNECDDHGAFEWKPVQIKMRLLPADNTDVVKLLAELTASGLIAKYTIEGREYGAVRNFCRYQRPKKPNSLYPIPHEFRTYLGLDSRNSEPDEDEPPSVPHQFPTGGEIPPQMEDGGGRGEEKKVSQSARAPRANGAMGSRLEGEWDPGDDGAKFARGLGLDPARVFARFRDYWTAQPGHRGRKADWQATWRNWCRKEAEQRGPLLAQPKQLNVVVGGLG